MNHAALDWARPDDGDLDDQVVKRSGAQAWQHRHLCPRLNLKNADRVRRTNHLVGRRVLGGDITKLEALAALLGYQVESAAYAAQHAEGKQVNFQEANRVQVIFVPLHNAAV